MSDYSKCEVRIWEVSYYLADENGDDILDENGQVKIFCDNGKIDVSTWAESVEPDDLIEISSQESKFPEPDLQQLSTFGSLLTNIETLAESIEYDAEDHNLTRKEIKRRANNIGFYVCTLREQLLKRGIKIV
jgi:hypothetical protein